MAGPRFSTEIVRPDSRSGPWSDRGMVSASRKFHSSLSFDNSPRRVMGRQDGWVGGLAPESSPHRTIGPLPPDSRRRQPAASSGAMAGPYSASMVASMRASRSVPASNRSSQAIGRLAQLLAELKSALTPIPSLTTSSYAYKAPRILWMLHRDRFGSQGSDQRPVGVAERGVRWRRSSQAEAAHQPNMKSDLTTAIALAKPPLRGRLATLISTRFVETRIRPKTRRRQRKDAKTVSGL